MPGKHLSAAACDRIRRLHSVHGDVVTCELTGISSCTLHNLKKRGFRPVERDRRPIPGDWGLVAPGLSNVQLMAHYHASGRVVARWRQEKPVPTKRAGVPAIPMPIDAVAVLTTQSRTQAARHYGVSVSTIGKWREQLGSLKHQVAARRAPGWVERYVAERRVA